MTLNERAMYQCNTPRSGLFIFVVLVAVTAAISIRPGKGCIDLPPPPHSTFTVNGDGKVNVHASVSQTHFVQGEEARSYLSLSLETPQGDAIAADRTPVDMVVVLDRSGSMGDPKKLPLAKQAIRDLLAQLNEEDRFALITFDHNVSVDSPLTAISSVERSRLLTIIDNLTPGGSTNIGEGVQKAGELFAATPSTRRRRVMLLSDGEANAGVVEPRQLFNLARGLTTHEAAFSTVGLGLGFNESLLSSMADYGMGSYSYLEDLSSLGTILSQNLAQTRATFATRSYVEIELSEGVTLADASGYPIEWNGAKAKIPTGQLTFGSRKNLTLTFQLPSSHLTSSRLGAVRFVYQQGDEHIALAVPTQTLAFSIVPSERRNEALASIDKENFRNSWLSNNLGLMQRQVQQSLKAGDYHKAKSLIGDYRAQVATAEEKGGVSLNDPKMTSDLASLEGRIDEVSAAPMSDQQEKLNRLVKEAHEDAIANQRK